MTTLVIDADYQCFRAATHAEEELDFSEDLTLVVGSFRKGKRRFKSDIDDLCALFGSTSVLLCFTDQKNFRKKIDPDYKGQRRHRKPAGYLKLKNWAMETWPSVMKPELEADDCLGILATSGQLDEFILITPDKDLEQIPCRIYNLKEEFTVTPEQAERRVWEQTLTGDATDGYAGCKGVGPKKAEAILDKAKGNYWPAVVAAYEKAGLTKEDALRNLRLAKILQTENWDSKKQEPILITP